MERAIFFTKNNKTPEFFHIFRTDPLKAKHIFTLVDKTWFLIQKTVFNKTKCINILSVNYMYITLKRYLITALSGYSEFNGIPQTSGLFFQISLKREFPYHQAFSISNALTETTIKIDNSSTRATFTDLW